MNDWYMKMKKQIEYCAYCPKMCRFSCPVAQVECSETVTPTAKATILKLVHEGALPFDREVGELIYLCSACIITRTYCEHDIEVFSPFEAARMEAVKKGVAPERVQKYAGKWLRQRNPFDEDLAEVIRDRAPKGRLGRTGTVLFPGCVTAHHFPEQVTDACKVLEAAGVDYRVLDSDEVCCGYPLLTLGHEKEFIEQAGRMAEILKEADLVVSPCPSCVYFLKQRFAEYGAPISAPVVHITELLNEKLDNLRVKSTDESTWIYHDPCYLGRYLGVYDPPRKVLKAATGSEPLEFFESREAATCCGGGGGLPVASLHTAEQIALEKMEKAPEYQTANVATACPTCQRMLARAGREHGLQVDHVVSILSRSI